MSVSNENELHPRADALGGIKFGLMKIISKLNSLRWLIIISIAMTVIGMLLDWKGFIVNTMAGVFGATIGVWVSVEVVEAIVEKRRIDEWNRVKEVVLRNITIQLIESSLEYLILLPTLGPYVKLLESTGEITKEKIIVLDQLQKAVTALDSELIEKEKYLELYRNIRPHFDRLHNIQLFHIFVPGQAIELVDHLQQLERAASDWDEVIFRNEKFGISKEVLSEKAINTLGAISDASKCLFNQNPSK